MCVTATQLIENLPCKVTTAGVISRSACNVGGSPECWGRKTKQLDHAIGAGQLLLKCSEFLSPVRIRGRPGYRLGFVIGLL